LLWFVLTGWGSGLTAPAHHSDFAAGTWVSLFLIYVIARSDWIDSPGCFANFSGRVFQDLLDIGHGLAAAVFWQPMNCSSGAFSGLFIGFGSIGRSFPAAAILAPFKILGEPSVGAFPILRRQSTPMNSYEGGPVFFRIADVVMGRHWESRNLHRIWIWIGCLPSLYVARYWSTQPNAQLLAGWSVAPTTLLALSGLLFWPAKIKGSTPSALS